MQTVDKDLKRSSFFLGNLEITEISCTAEVIYDEVKKFLKAKGVDISKLHGFGSDGASIMTGKIRGVAARFKEDCPFLISVHCIAHRLNLVTEKAALAVPFVASFQQTLTDVYFIQKQSLPGTISPQTCRPIECVEKDFLCESQREREGGGGRMLLKKRVKFNVLAI